jgi:hypothetical protein
LSWPRTLVERLTRRESTPALDRAMKSLLDVMPELVVRYPAKAERDE